MGHSKFRYNNKRYYLEVQEVKPQEAACIIECDCNVDFSAPVGYTEPDYASARSRDLVGASQLDLPAPQKALSKAREEDAKCKAAGLFKPFVGDGQRLDGKELKSAQSALIEAMPKQPTKAEQAKIWQSTGMTCASAVPAQLRSGSSTVQPKKPVFRKPVNAKWAKANKAAFTGIQSSLK